MKPQDLLSKLVGLTKDDALTAIKEGGFAGRVVSEDGRTKLTDCQYVPSRINLTLAGGKTVEASVG